MAAEMATASIDFGRGGLVVIVLLFPIFLFVIELIDRSTPANLP